MQEWKRGPFLRLGQGSWLASILLLAVVVFPPAESRADTPLVSGDSLTEAACTACSAGVTRTNEGGAFTPEGWSQNVEDSRIIYDLGHGVACARITFEATGWDPNENMQGLGEVDNYHNNFGLFEGSHGDPDLAGENRESSIIIQTVAAPDRVCLEHHCRNIKLLAWAVPLFESFGHCPECDEPWCYACGGFGWTDTDANWSMDNRYSFEVTWNHEGASLTVSEMDSDPVIRETSAGWLDSNPMRYFFLGDVKVSNGKNITGPVYTNVWVWEVSPCADPCQGHCSNDVQDCVEKDVDCGGRCTPCGTTNTPPQTGQIQVFSATGDRLDEGGRPALRGETIVLKASVSDAETAEAGMRSCRFYLRGSGSASWDMLDSGQAVFVASEPTELRWQHEWTVPADAPLQWYDIRFYYEDEGGLSADQTQPAEFQVDEALEPIPDQVTPDRPDVSTDAVHDAGQDDAGQEGNGGVGGGCGCAVAR